MLFLAEDDYERQRDDITETFRWKSSASGPTLPADRAAAVERRVRRADEGSDQFAIHRLSESGGDCELR